MTTNATATTLQAPSVLLLGTVGSGKTYSLATLIESGLELFVISTEPTGLDSLLDVMRKKNLDMSKLHWKHIQPARIGIEGLLEMSKKIGVMNFEQLAKLPPSAGRQHAQFMQVLNTCNDFIDDKDGKSYGSVQTFGADKALVIDSLSGLNLMTMDMVIGDKPSAHVGEWGVAMTLLEKFILNLCSNLRCIFVLTGHLERETNELTGATQTMASTLGRKLAPRLPRFFSEVVMTSREPDGFFWSTLTQGVDLKNRALPAAAKLAPTFEPIVQVYRERLAQAKAA